jgi:hypothetical protein
MGSELTSPSFDDWVTYVFDHSVTEPAWHWDSDCDIWYVLNQPALAVEHLTRLFENAATVLGPFTNAQLCQGLWFLASNGCSDHLFTLTDPNVPWPARQQAILAIAELFEQVFAKRCEPDRLCHRERTVDATANRLNTACCMWWDIVPLSGLEDRTGTEGVPDACLAVMRRTLALESDACRESALHGLGHFKRSRPREVEAIIDDFLDRFEPPGPKRKRRPSPTPVLRPELREYAGQVRLGYVQ